ncbi:BAI1-associated protein 3-like isoform X2 [Tachypleus tridentatus]|uniref:BAI1-associated protein 3-like isoform X2 n=1 Tax=Tachypleus tridentatus TaxID=6853 RepID=UPI003FD4E3BD
MPRKHKNKHFLRRLFRVKDADGGFFENFTALSWKQENRRLQASRVCEAEKEHLPPIEPDLGITAPEFKIGKKDWERLYVEVLYTIKHKIGASSADYVTYTTDLYEYAQKAFQMSPEHHRRLFVVAQDEKPPIPVLNVVVVEAQGLEAKDPNGFSDPYCMLGILQGCLQESRRNSSDEEMERGRSSPRRQGLRKFGASFKRRDRTRSNSISENLPAKFIRTTTVKPHTLNPKWNEQFRLDIDDVHTEKLHLDIWDHDDESSVFDAARKLNEVSGFKGLGRYFKQIYQSARSEENKDDFLGCVTIPIEEIPSNGLDKFFPLQGRTARSTIQGQIRLKLSLGTRGDRETSAAEDNWKEVLEHQQLLWLFIEHELKNYEGKSYEWTGDLPKPAQTILLQHAIQGNVTEFQQVLCRWLMYSRKYVEVPLDLAVLHKLLDEVNTAWKNSDTNLAKDEEAALTETFNVFIDYCLAQVRKCRDLFPPGNQQSHHKLIYLLKCLDLIHNMDVFKRCCPFRHNLHVEITNTIKRGTLDWFNNMNAFTLPQVPTEENILNGLNELANALNSDLQKSVSVYNEIFESNVKVSYSTVVYKQLEKLLADLVAKKLHKVEENVGYKVQETCTKVSVTDGGAESQTLELGTAMFELYLNLQEFVRFRDKLPQNERTQLVISNYHLWFSDVIDQWFTVAKVKARQRIKKALELDKIQCVDNLVKYSTSAVDTVTCFSQIKQFWFQLSWPDLAGSYPFIIKLLQDICSGAEFYANLCHQNLVDSGYYDEEGPFDVTEQLCITINNIEHVRTAIRPLLDELGVEEILKNVADREGEKSASQCRETVNSLLHNSEEQVLSKIIYIADAVSGKMCQEIKTHIFHLAWTPEKMEADVYPLINYLDNNLKTLYNNMFRANFDRILESIWKVVLQELTSTAKSNIGENMNFFQRLLDSLKHIVDFFHAENTGLSLDALYCPAYRDLEQFLSLQKTDTNQLIEKYVCQRIEEQEGPKEEELGYLTVKTIFNPGSDSLCVDVLNARELRPLDTNGFSDPFVIIELVPRHLYPECPPQRTKVQKKTLYPLFDESFEFTITINRSKLKCSALCFTVMDHDVVTKNDFEGEVYLPLRNVPGVCEEQEKDPKLMELPLIQPREKNEILAVLEARTWDKTAQDFAKEQRAKLS